jgi:hypothetical protein
MNVQLEATEVMREVETGIQHQRFRFDGSDVRFDADGLYVQAGGWILALDHDRQGQLLGIRLELADVDGENLDRIDDVIPLPENARSPQGADVVRLQLRQDVLDGVIRPVADTLEDLPALLQIHDGDGQPVVFHLANFDLIDMAPKD